MPCLLPQFTAQHLSLFNMIQGALAGAEGVFELSDQTLEHVVTATPAPFVPLGGEGTFDAVDFAYTPAGAVPSRSVLL